MLSGAIDLTALLSADNAARKHAEQALDALQESAPAQLSMQLAVTLASPAAAPEVRELSAVLLRRRLPEMLLHRSLIVSEWREAIKAKLLEALTAESAPRLRRKICDTVGRIGLECLTDGSWPQLMEFVRAACASGVPSAHEVALTVIRHMAPTLVDPRGWPTIGKPATSLLLAGLGTPSGEVSGAALAALSDMLAACAEQESTAETGAEKKQLKAVATELAAALPPMLGCLEAAVTSSDPARVSSVLESLGTVAAAQPRLFKSVLPVVTEGLCQLASTASLPVDARMSCVELLLTLAEGAPKMVTKLDAFTPRLLSVLVPMLLRLGGDLSEWEEAEPDDGLLETDDDEDGEKEAAYACEGLDRLSECVGGQSLTRLLLPMLQPYLAEGAPWNARHAALVAIATVCEAGFLVIEPHIESIVGLVRAAVAAPEARLRWAAFYCLGLMCDEFPQLAEEMHATLVPVVTGGMSDACARVRAAATLASVNLMQQMEEEQMLEASPQLLGALHASIASPASPPYLAYTACAALAVLSDALAAVPGRPMAQAYPSLMPLLGQRLAPALASRYGRLAAELLHAMGKLAAAAGAEAVAATAGPLIRDVSALLQRPEVLEDRTLLRGAHTTLTSLAEMTGGAFVGALEGLLPALLEKASIEVEFEISLVEGEDPRQAEAEADEGYEVEYLQNKGKGMIKIKTNAAQMDEKLLALDALFAYAHALGAAFEPAVRPVVEAALPVLSYKFNEQARASAALVLGEAYKCLVLAAANGTPGATMARVSELAGALLKPLSERLNKEDSLVAADAMLDCLREMLVLEREHRVGVLAGGPALNGVIQLVKRHLALDEARLRERAEEAAQRDDDDDGDDDAPDDEQEAELLTSCAALTIELVRQHGEAALPQVEAQLLPHMQAWLVGAAVEEEGQIVRLALGLDVVSGLIEHCGQAAAKKYVAAVLPLLQAHVGATDARLRRSAFRGMGVVIEHGGKLLSRPAATQVAERLVSVLSAPDARFSNNVGASEAAAAALGRLLVHRAPSVDAPSVLPLWLRWLPLRHSADDAPIAMTCLCQLLEADAAAVFGPQHGAFPQVLGALAAAYEHEDTTAPVSARMRSLVSGWSAANRGLLEAGTAALPAQYMRDKVVRMVAA